MVNIKEVRVIDMMKPARTVGRDMPIAEALKLMKAEKLDFLSITDDNNRLIGAISENNFIRIVRHDSFSPMGDPLWFSSVEPEAGARPISTIMTNDITTIKPNEDISTALRVMSSVGYKLLHVVDSDGKLMGIVRIKDMFEKFLGV